MMMVMMMPVTAAIAVMMVMLRHFHAIQLFGDRAVRTVSIVGNEGSDRIWNRV